MVKRLSWLNLPPWKKKNHEGRVSWCDSGGRWDVLALSGAVPGLWCQFSCSLCVTAGMRVWEVTPTACCLFMPPAGHSFSSATLGWCQCHCLTLLPHSGRARSSCWAPKTALLAALVPGCSFRSVTFEPPIWKWSRCLFSAQLSCRNVLEGSEM